ncbi:unnamed protein product [Sphagnum troendelagicum]|uniref:Secreted protein n=1 Tax=Sphagnum troendelagicum TaxID=128251 RepID=A0ABP0UJN4_9BRYO
MMAQLVAMAITSSVCGSNCAANAKSVSSASSGGSNKPEITGLLRCRQRLSKREWDVLLLQKEERRGVGKKKQQQ